MTKMTQQNNLNHSGVMGMKWGHRKALKKTATDAFNAEVDTKSQALLKAGRAEEKNYRRLKREGNQKEASKSYAKASKMISDSAHMRTNYTKDTAIAASVVLGVAAAPAAMKIASMATKQKGAKKAAVILASGLGTVAVTSLMMNNAATKAHKQALSDNGIKSVKDRMKEMN